MSRTEKKVFFILMWGPGWFVPGIAWAFLAFCLARKRCKRMDLEKKLSECKAFRAEILAFSEMMKLESSKAKNATSENLVALLATNKKVSVGR